MINSKIKRGLFAGLWFAAAALIPVAISVEVSRQNPLGELIIYSVVLPILTAAFCGALLGAAILNPNIKQSALQAAVRGFMIAVLGYFIWIAGYSVFKILPTGDVVGSIAYIAIAFVYSLFIVLLTALLGAAAGWLLYLFRRKISPITN